MFTGIVEELGKVKTIARSPNAVQLQLSCKQVLTDVNIGDSIAVNGVCLTVKDFNGSYFTADVMPETVKATTIHTLQVGDSVNLERAMAANGRFGGHFVSGHVDGVGEITKIRPEANAIYMHIKIDTHLLRYFIDKGSVTVDGTSLTVFDITQDGFVISLIPVTQADSIIGQKQVGDTVNIECDVLAKYIERLLGQQKEQNQDKVTLAMLSENGFLN